MVNYDIGKKRIELGDDNKQMVFNAIRSLTLYDSEKGVRLVDIWRYLDKETQLKNKDEEGVLRGIYESGSRNWTGRNLEEGLEMSRKKSRTISRRTIQRCIDNDPRIKKSGWYFTVDNDARFEKRYNMNTRHESRVLFKAYVGETSNRYIELLKAKRGSRDLPLDKRMTKMVLDTGVYMVYLLLEACKPFRDKSMSITEREDLVRHWITTAVPIEQILENFLWLFKPGYLEFDPRKDVYDPYEYEKKDLSLLEMKEETIQKVSLVLEETYPEWYNALTSAAKLPTAMRPEKRTNNIIDDLKLLKIMIREELKEKRRKERKRKIE